MRYSLLIQKTYNLLQHMELMQKKIFFQKANIIPCKHFKKGILLLCKSFRANKIHFDRIGWAEATLIRYTYLAQGIP